MSRTGLGGFWRPHWFIQNMDPSFQVKCEAEVNESQLYPFYFSEFSPREVFPSHRESAIAGSVDSSRFTGTSGTIAWHLGDRSTYLIVMWSVPYNLKIFNSYFAIGMVKMSTAFNKDMLPYWYRKMISYQRGRLFRRGEEGTSVVFEEEDVFVIAKFGKGYQTILNIR